MMQAPNSKLDLDGARLPVQADEACALVKTIFRRLGCSHDTARQIAEHLTDTSLCGMESHGLMRTLQYAEQMESGYMQASATPSVACDRATARVDGSGGSGIPAMAMAFREGTGLAQAQGLAAVSIGRVGHTGRHGAFADAAAAQGFLTILMGGGNRETWRQVAPYGGAKAKLPTNPWCIGMPGGDRGPVVLDFATSRIAGGWIYAARSAGARLPADSLIDAEGRPTQNPEDYFSGGAILPMGGHKGYGLAVVAELIGHALLGPEATEGNWLLLVVDTVRWRGADQLRALSEEVLDDLRTCPPAPGFDAVEIPGERERAHRDASGGIIQVPEATWNQIIALADRLGAKPE